MNKGRDLEGSCGDLINVLFQYLLGQTVENHEKRESG
jgi:hypothetical protein